MFWRATLSMSAALTASFCLGQLHATTYVSGLSAPMQMIQDPTHPDTQYVVERGGQVKVVQAGVVNPTDFLDIHSNVTTDGERGLLSMALAPDYATSGNAYVYYTNANGDIQIERFTRSSANPLTLDASTGLNIIGQAHPNFNNHNGGTLAFGSDGFLYAGLGDGGSGNDPDQNGQNPNTLLAKMIRIDPSQDAFPGDPDRNYAIPNSNPFANGGGPINAMGEIWSFGYRNPFRFSFDDPAHGGNGGMIIGDVGQDGWEEVDYEVAGSGGHNYGWRIREGANDSGLGGNIAYNPLTDPIYQYSHDGSGKAIIGGRIYRGNDLGSNFQGRYFFGDEVTGQVWSLHLSYDAAGNATASDLQEHTNELGSSAIGTLVSFDTDSNGEMYIVNLSGGTISKITPVPEPMTLLVLAGGLALMRVGKVRKKL